MKHGPYDEMVCPIEDSTLLTAGIRFCSQLRSELANQS
jgi:hypothetical protein